MELKFNNLPKVVINLKRREDRLKAFRKEMDFMGWNYNVFEAVDTGDYLGCALSHKKIAEDFLNSDQEYLLVMEDDAFFMPYAKKVILEVESELNKVEWNFFHLGPAIHRPLERYNQILIDLNNLPPKDEDKHRGIFGTHAFILTKKSAEIISQWDTSKYIPNEHRHIAIDDYFDRVLYKMVRAFCPYLLITSQQNDFSDINKTFDNNHYKLTYNWSQYLPDKLPKEMEDINYCKSLKQYE